MTRTISFILLGFAVHAAATAHEARPVTVHVTVRADGVVTAIWVVPAHTMLETAPTLRMPEGFEPLGPPIEVDTSDAKRYTAQFRTATPIEDATIALDFESLNPGLQVFMRITTAEGAVYTSFLPPGVYEFRVPMKESALRVAREYGGLGVAHILAGIDHILFLVCLLIMAGTARRTVLTITGFTLGHAITVTLASLQIVRVPAAPVEAAIALSIAILAAEIVRGRKDSLTFRYPVLVSAAFGLIHGLGFASALEDFGLPQTQLPAALIAFNLGVEAGQLLFIAAILGAGVVVQRYLPKDSRRIAAYGAGLIAMVWTLERTATILS